MESGRSLTRSESAERGPKFCWICFGSEEEDIEASWVHPCNCRGTTKWVHQSCLLRWIDEKQSENRFQPVVCPQCQTQYIIVFPDMGILANTIEIMDYTIENLCSFLAAGMMGCIFYWSSLTFGAITVMQAIGIREGVTVLQETDPVILMMGLPLIPVCLILGRLINWEDQVLYFIRNKLPRIPVLKHLLPFRIDVGPLDSHREDALRETYSASLSRNICGALLLPSFSSLTDRIISGFLYKNQQHSVKRLFFGGIVFLLIKGCLKIYQMQMNYVRLCERQILDYTPTNLRLFNDQ